MSTYNKIPIEDQCQFCDQKAEYRCNNCILIDLCKDHVINEGVCPDCTGDYSNVDNDYIPEEECERCRTETRISTLKKIWDPFLKTYWLLCKKCVKEVRSGI
jgi:hypothetical protein